MLTPNSILQNRYLIVRLLGQGGMGAVYEAVDQRVSCVVALKQTLVGGNNEARQAFQREAALLANLRHSSLPKVMDYFGEGEDEFLVMEFIPGHDLAERLALRDSPFPEAQVVQWANDILKLLVYLHTRQPAIVHRDIKPANLKVTSQGEIFLLDFGLAKGAAGQMATIQTSKSLRGYTPFYAPLEQIHGSRTDPRSDLYALGATLYHLLTGQPPLSAPERFEAVDNDRPDPLKPTNELNFQVSPEIAELIQSAMAVRRKDRFATAAEMRIDLERASMLHKRPSVKREEEEELAQAREALAKKEKQARLRAEREEKERQEIEAARAEAEARQRAKIEADRLSEQRRLQLEAEEKALIEQNEKLNRRRAEIEVARNVAEEEGQRLAEIQARISDGETARRRAEYERLRLEAEVRLRAQKEQERLKETRDRIADTDKEIDEMRHREEEEEETRQQAKIEADRRSEQRRLQLEAEEKALIEQNEELNRRRAEIEVARNVAEEEGQRLAEIQARISDGETARRRAEHERLRLEAEVRLRAQKEQERLKETRDRIADAHKEIDELRRRAEAEERELQELRASLARAEEQSIDRSKIRTSLTTRLRNLGEGSEPPETL